MKLKTNKNFNKRVKLQFSREEREKKKKIYPPATNNIIIGDTRRINKKRIWKRFQLQGGRKFLDVDRHYLKDVDASHASWVDTHTPFFLST
jgi:hypothetical protein